MKTTITTVPYELLLQVIENLNIKDLVTIRAVSRLMRTAVDHVFFHKIVKTTTVSLEPFRQNAFIVDGHPSHVSIPLTLHEPEENKTDPYKYITSTDKVSSLAIWQYLAKYAKVVVIEPTKDRTVFKPATNGGYESISWSHTISVNIGAEGQEIVNDRSGIRLMKWWSSGLELEIIGVQKPNEDDDCVFS